MFFSFFLDFMGSLKAENVVEALGEVEKITTKFKVLGCYKERKMK